MYKYFEYKLPTCMSTLPLVHYMKSWARDIETGNKWCRVWWCLTLYQLTRCKILNESKQINTSSLYYNLFTGEQWKDGGWHLVKCKEVCLNISLFVSKKDPPNMFSLEHDLFVYTWGLRVLRVKLVFFTRFLCDHLNSYHYFIKETSKIFEWTYFSW